MKKNQIGFMKTMDSTDFYRTCTKHPVRLMAFGSFDPFLLVFSSSGRALSMPRYMPAKIQKAKPTTANQTKKSKYWGRFTDFVLQGLRLRAVTKLLGCLVIKFTIIDGTSVRLLSHSALREPHPWSWLLASRTARINMGLTFHTAHLHKFETT